MKRLVEEWMDLLNQGPPTRNLRIMFQDREFLLIACPLRGPISGAIATPEQYDNCLPSFAHLMPDGSVMRYNVQIGTREDVHEITDEEVTE